MATFTFTVPDAQVPRVQAALQATGETPKAFLTACLVSLVQSFEQQQNAQQYSQSYTPIQVS